MPDTLRSKKAANAGLTNDKIEVVMTLKGPPDNPKACWMGNRARTPATTVAIPAHREISPK